MLQVRGTAPAAAPRASGCTSVTPAFRPYQSREFSTLRRTCSSTRSCDQQKRLYGVGCPGTASSLGTQEEERRERLLSTPTWRYLSALTDVSFQGTCSLCILPLFIDVWKNTCRCLDYFIKRWSNSNFYCHHFPIFLFMGFEKSSFSVQTKPQCLSAWRVRGESLHAKVRRSFQINSVCT